MTAEQGIAMLHAWAPRNRTAR